MSHAAERPNHFNEVHLVGRLATAPSTRELPSGDVLLSLRLVVGRAGTRKGATTRSPTVDTLDCAVWRADVRRRALSLQPGETIEIHGALRRRFWRQGVTPVSRSEVEVFTLRRVRPSGLRT